MWTKIKQFLFYNRTIGQTAAKNAFWLSVSNFGGRLIRAIIIIYAARVLGAYNWGVFNYAITLVTFLSVFTEMGINRILIRETAKAADETRRLQILSTSFLIMLTLTAASVCIILFAAPYFIPIPEAKALLPLVVFILFFDTFREFGFSFIRALEKMEWETGLYLLTNFAIVAFGFFFLRVHPTVRAFTFSYMLGTGIGMAATYIVLRGNLKQLIKNFSAKLIKPILSSAWPFAISLLLGMLMINTDILIIGAFRSAEDVGFYSAGQRIIQLLYLIPGILTISILPAFSRAAANNPEKMRAILERVLRALFLISIPAAVGGILLGPQIIALVFGHSYLPATAPFQILLLTIIVDFSAVVLTTVMFAYDKQKNLILYSAIGGGLNVALDLALIPRFGMVGSAWATFGAQLVSNAYLWHIVKKTTEFHVFPHMKRIVIATLGMGLMTFLLSQAGVHVIGTILISILAYFGMLYLLREPILREIKTILQPPHLS